MCRVWSQQGRLAVSVHSVGPAQAAAFPGRGRTAGPPRSFPPSSPLPSRFYFGSPVGLWSSIPLRSLLEDDCWAGVWTATEDAWWDFSLQAVGARLTDVRGLPCLVCCVLLRALTTVALWRHTSGGDGPGRWVHWLRRSYLSSTWPFSLPCSPLPRLQVSRSFQGSRTRYWTEPARHGIKSMPPWNVLSPPSQFLNLNSSPSCTNCSY